MLVLVTSNKFQVINQPSEMEVFLLGVDIHALFKMPSNIDFSIFNENLTTGRRIYKVGFLNEVYRKLYPEKNKLELIEQVILENDLFINARQFRIDAKTYNEKINYIFV
jgi:hypothetical protein